jgi:hypothetical protein
MRSLPCRGLWLDLAVLGRNVVGCVVLAAAAVARAARSRSPAGRVELELQRRWLKRV